MKDHVRASYYPFHSTLRSRRFAKREWTLTILLSNVKFGTLFEYLIESSDMDHAEILTLAVSARREQRKPSGDELKDMLKTMGSSQLQILRSDSNGMRGSLLGSRAASFPGRLAVMQALPGKEESVAEAPLPSLDAHLHCQSLTDGKSFKREEREREEETEALLLAVELNAKAR